MWCWERFHLQHVGCFLVLWVVLAAATGHVNSIGDEINKTLNETIDPCIDFYHFSCREWKRHNRIPVGADHYNRFEEVKKEISNRLKDLLEPPHDSVADRSYVRKAKDLYMACMNEEQLSRLGAKPIQDLLKGLKFWPSTQGTPLYLEPALAEVNELFEITASPLLNAFVYSDQLNRSNNIVWIEEGRTFLRRRDIPKDGQWSDSVQRTVQRFTALVNATLSPGDWTGSINKVMEFEIKLAKLAISFQERKDKKQYNKWTLYELHQRMPWFNWVAYLQPLFDAAGQTLSTSTEVAVQAAKSIDAMIKLCRDTDSKTIADYLMIRVLNSFKKYLSREFREFFKQGKERSMMCIKDVTKFMGAAVGKMYSTKYFTIDDKDTVADMASEITNAFKQLIWDSKWLSLNTKIKAVDKVGAIKTTVGFPDWYEDPENIDNFYADVDYSPYTYFNNSVEGFWWLKKRNAELLPKPAKRHDFLATEVNFRYGGAYNDMIFPAGVFLPPFYNKRYPRSMRYGAIGMFIGHELMHSVGLIGRHYDRNGKLEAWPEEDLAEYDNRSLCFLEQYNAQVVESLNVDGSLTLEENIADNVGLKAAFKAYKRWTEKNGPEPRVAGLERFSHEQLFFISYGQMWCERHKKQWMKDTIDTSIHGPRIVRARVPPANTEDFARIFNCANGTNMNPLTKCTLW